MSKVNAIVGTSFAELDQSEMDFLAGRQNESVDSTPSIVLSVVSILESVSLFECAAPAY